MPIINPTQPFIAPTINAIISTRIKMTTASAVDIQIGARTQIHAQLITLYSLSVINTIVNNPQKDIPL